MHQRTNRKIIIYLFLFAILASVNNFKYINLQLFKIDFINISGLNDMENSNLYEKIINYKKKNIFFIDNLEISKNINSNNLVEKFWVFKEYPSTININLIKTNFLGITKINNIDYLIGSNGKLIKKRNDQVVDLPFIFGSIDANDFLILKEILDKSNFDASKIENFYYFKSNRWDIKTKKGLVIRLPSEVNVNLLNTVNQIIEDENFKNIKTLDFRQTNQIITYE
ncbi:FtsQ-type POTRA domain-containing protein [Candidatus Pelagibacter sp.]|jgi:cell division protein FtsQ|nr:FtsQ-type POTRA domain-containing protein [Candidatus Pelagibacter sp.]